MLGKQWIVYRLKSQCHRDTTRQIYYTIWKLFSEFYLKLDCKPTEWEERITLYAAYLIDTNKQYSTVNSYISAIKAVLQEEGIELKQNQFLLTALTRACKLHNDCFSVKLPIHQDLLAIILSEIHKAYNEKDHQPYLALLYRTIFSTSYFGLFRVSEKAQTPGNHAVKVGDVQIGQNKKKFMFVLRSSKTHNSGNTPQIIKISSTKKKGNTQRTNRLELPCPFDLLHQYSRCRTRTKVKKKISSSLETAHQLLHSTCAIVFQTCSKQGDSTTKHIHYILPDQVEQEI